MKSKRKGPDVIKVSLWLCAIVAMVVAAGLVYYFSGSQPSDVSRIVIYVLLGAAAAAVVRLAVWGFGWVRKERVSELGLHIVRFAVILTAVVLCVFAMMSADYSSQYRQSASNELRQQALAARIHLQDVLGEELGTDAIYYIELYDELPELLDDSAINADRHVNLYLFVSPDRQPAGTAFSAMAENDGIFAAGTSSRFGETASASYIEKVFNNGKLTFSEYIHGQAGFESSFMSAFVPVFTAAGRPVGVLELCEPGMSVSSLLGFAAVELLLRIVALIAMFAFGFYGVMQLLDILLRPKSVDRSCRVLSCGREAARPVLFFVSLCVGLPVMLLISSEEMRGLISFEAAPDWVNGIAGVIPACLYLLCFLLGWMLVRRNRGRLTEAPSNASLVVATLCAIALILLKDTQIFANVAIMNEWYIPLVLIALCGVCYGISYRTISKYQAQSDLLFGMDKYAYLCTALGIITGMILGGWLLDASGEAGVKVAMLLLNAAACVISIVLLEDLDQTVEGTHLSESKVLSVGGLSLVLIPLGLACAYVWVYAADYLAAYDYSVTARSIVIAAPIIAFCFGNRLNLRTRNAQRGALCIGGVIAGLAAVTMIWTPAPVMAVASCGLLCLSVVFVSAGVYSSLRADERGGAFRILLITALAGVLGFAAMNGFFAGRLCLLVISIVSVIMSFAFLGTKFPNRIAAPEYHDAIRDGEAKPVPEYSLPEAKKQEETAKPAEEVVQNDYRKPERDRWYDDPVPSLFADRYEKKEEPVQSVQEPEEKKSPAEPEPEENKYDWDRLDVQTADVMSEFFSMFGEESKADEAKETAQEASSEQTAKPASENPDAAQNTAELNDMFIFFPDENDTPADNASEKGEAAGQQ